jgi:two-component system response regulator
MPHPVTILLVEDNPDDEALTVMALRGVPATLEVARDGQEAMDYLTNHGVALPRLVLLDLKLPKIDGLEVLRRIREDDRTRLTPAVVLTSSNALNDVVASYRLGANSYVRKPVNFDQFSDTIRQLGTYWLAVNEPPPDAPDQ